MKKLLALLLLLPSLALAAGSAVKSYIGQEDINWGSPAETFSRQTSTGGLLTLHKVSKGPLVDIREYGAIPGAAAAANTTAIQAALDSSAGTIVVPEGTFQFTTLTQTRDDVELVLMAGAVLESTVSTHLTSNITWSGARGRISGPGTIKSPAAWDGANDTDVYATVRVSGDAFGIDGVTFENIVRCGVLFDNVSNGSVRGCRFHGNYPSGSYTGSETGHFGVWVDPTPAGNYGNFQIVGNQFESCVQGVYLGNQTGATAYAYGVTITGNTFVGCHNHGIYGVSHVGTTITGNTFTRCSSPIVTTGAGHVISGNTISTWGTGTNLDYVSIAVRDPVRCIVTGNSITGETSNGQVILNVGAVSGTACNDNIIADNVISVSTGTSVGIRVGDVSASNKPSRNRVTGNIVSVVPPANRGAIEILASSGKEGSDNVVSGNIITNASENYGIYALYQSHATIQGNETLRAYDAAAPATTAELYLDIVTQSRIAGNRWRCSSAYGTNLTLRAMQEAGASDYNEYLDNKIAHDPTKLAASVPFVLVGANSSKRGNRYTPTGPLSGQATLVAGAATVTTTEVVASDSILLTPVATGGTPGWVRVSAITAGTNFTITSSSGTDTSAVYWEIVH